MPIFGIDEQLSQGTLQEVPPTTGEVVEASFDEAWADNPISRITDYTLTKTFGGTQLTKQQVEQFAADEGIEVKNIPENGLSAGAAGVIFRRQKEKKIRADVLDHAQGGFVEGTAKIGAQFAASLMDPINVATGFIPVVGQARYSAMLARSGGSIAARAGVRAGVGAAEGAVGAAVTEAAINYPLAQELGDDYTAANSLINVAFGAVMGAGLHAGVGGIADAWKARKGIPDADPSSSAQPKPGVPEQLSRRSPELREAALKTAVSQLESGKSLDVTPIIDADTLELRMKLEKTETELRNSTDPAAVQEKVAEIKELEARISQVERTDANFDTAPKSIETLVDGFDGAKKMEIFDALTEASRFEAPAKITYKGAQYEVKTATHGPTILAREVATGMDRVLTYNDLASTAGTKIEVEGYNTAPKDIATNVPIARESLSPKDATLTPETLQKRVMEKAAEPENSRFIDNELTAKIDSELAEAPPAPKDEIEAVNADFSEKLAELESEAAQMGVENIKDSPEIKAARELEVKAKEYETAMNAAWACSIRKGAPE